MAGVLDSVNQRTQLVGQNRLELLLFRLRGRQIYGINVFKVKEVLQCPKLSSLPNSRPVVRGVAHSRGETIPIIDLSMAIGLPGIPQEELATSFVIITEYNRKTQGFLVTGVDRIVEAVTLASAKKGRLHSACVCSRAAASRLAGKQATSELSRTCIRGDVGEM